MNRKEMFIISLTIFLTILAWVIYDLLQIKYKEFPVEHFEKILQTQSSFSTNMIEVLKQKEP